jgi:hypothetical protein
MTADTIRGESEFIIFSRFSRAFSHVVRGDLSVITNEVSYLATQMPSEELGRVRNRCSQIAATISKIAGLQSEISTTSIGTDAAARIFGATLDRTADDVVSLDCVKIERLASSIRQMLPPSDASWTAECSSISVLTLSRTIRGFQGVGARYASWSSFASKELGERSVIDAVVADLIMRAHGWRLALESSPQELRCSLFIPLVAVEQPELQCA